MLSLDRGLTAEVHLMLHTLEPPDRSERGDLADPRIHIFPSIHIVPSMFVCVISLELHKKTSAIGQCVLYLDYISNGFKGKLKSVSDTLYSSFFSFFLSYL